jgi:DNA-binding MarR family transcriptional regulator
MSTPEPHDPYDICACAQVRRTARLLTQRYDAALRPTGLKVTQFSILRTLEKLSDVSMTALAERLTLDRTGLTRNLKPLERDGLIAIHPGRDSRQRIVQLTAKGRDKLEQAMPIWRELQHGIVDTLGAEQANAIMAGLTGLNQAAQKA